MFGKKFTIEEKMRLQEELQDIVDKYGIENVKAIFEQYLASYESTQKLVNQEQKEVPKHDDQVGIGRIEEEKPENQVKLPLNVRSVAEFETGFNEVCASNLVAQDIIESTREYILGAKKIYSGDLSDKNYIMSLTSELFPDRIFKNPQEDWINYNAGRIRTYLKRHLRLKGYQFLDSEVEVGKHYDSRKHNCLKKESVKDSAMDGRVLKVVSEGLIIGRILHINCNVIVGQYFG